MNDPRVKVMANGCWEWQARKINNGYGILNIDGKQILAHRYFFEMFKHKIPEGLELDHLCKNRPCVNPEHLEAVTHRENVRRCNSPMGKNSRMTHCKNGHEYTPETTKMQGNHRHCRPCESAYHKARRLAKKQEKLKPSSGL